MRAFKVNSLYLEELCWRLEYFLRAYPDSDYLASLKTHNQDNLTGEQFVKALTRELKKVEPIYVCEDGAIYATEGKQHHFIASFAVEKDFQKNKLFQSYAKTYGDGQIFNVPR